MDMTALFTVALGLQEPWYVDKIEFKSIQEEAGYPPSLHIWLKFRRGSRFPCPVNGCGEPSPVHDTVEHTWRHLNFFQYKTFLHANVPRIRCCRHGVHTVQVPWARPGSGFTLLFESMILLMASQQPVSAIAKTIGETDTCLWRFIKKYVELARDHVDVSDVQALGMDETSKKGQNYITVFADLVRKCVLDIQPGKNAACVDAFCNWFESHGGHKDKVIAVTTDMALGFRAGILKHFSNAAQIIDKFHIIKHANEALDDVRKAESKKQPALKGSKYVWLKNFYSLSKAQIRKFCLMHATGMHLVTARAYRMKLAAQNIYERALTYEEAKEGFEKLISWIMHSNIPRMKSFAKMLKSHLPEILNYWRFKYTNAILEGLNSIIQNVKRRARGFRNDRYFSTMIFLTCGKLPIGLLKDANEWRRDLQVAEPATT